MCFCYHFGHPAQLKGFNFCCDCYCIVILWSHRVFPHLYAHAVDVCMFLNDLLYLMGLHRPMYSFFFFSSFGCIYQFLRPDSYKMIDLIEVFWKTVVPFSVVGGGMKEGRKSSSFYTSWWDWNLCLWLPV